jgi:membrane-associated protease RseP (regulator of RpoE activity)
MDAILILIMLLLTFPIVSLLHEWGHYVTAKGLGMEVSKIQLGTGKALSKWFMGETEVEYNWNSFYGGHTLIQDAEYFSRTKQVIVILAGVLLSLIMYILSWNLLKVVELNNTPLLKDWLYIFMMMNLYMGVVHLFPFRKGIKRGFIGHPSDGLALFYALKNPVKERPKEELGSTKLKRKKKNRDSK